MYIYKTKEHIHTLPDFIMIYMHKYRCYRVAHPLFEITQQFYSHRIDTFDLLKKKNYLLLKK